MKKSMLILALGTFLVGVTAVKPEAVNISGKRTLEVSNRGRTQELVIVFNHVGDELTGQVIWNRRNLSSPSPVNTEIYQGKVEGDLVSFYVWEGRDQPKKAYYEGKISDGEIHFAVTGGNSRVWGDAVSEPRQLAALPIPTPNFSGKWSMEIPRRWGGGTREATVVLNQIGSEVTGEFSVDPWSTLVSFSPLNSEIWDGKVEGNQVSFYVWRGSDAPRKIQYQGEISEDEIRFTLVGGQEGRAGDETGPRELVARRTM